ncbi:MAG: hypothetical protein DRI94_12595 [Bacteroidetes bacterium]|nr:MAG: hypothetical protein DRI94_12595 [Bacteroidota bacterium]
MLDKKTIYLKCIETINLKIENLQNEINEAQKQANEYGCPKDRYDAFRSQLLRKKDMLSRQLQQFIDDKNNLLKIDLDKKINTVEFGAFVVTNRQKMFISVSLGKIQIDDTEIYAISTLVPMYNTIKGLKVGDKANHNGLHLEILEIY